MNINRLYNDLQNYVGEGIDRKYLISRELSWMKFNKRVLSQTLLKLPLMEKLKFVAISASNLDEFMMVRLASVKSRLGTLKTDISGMLPEDEYAKLLAEICLFKKEQEMTLKSLETMLEKSNIKIYNKDNIKSLSKTEKEYIRKVFNRSIYPVLTPIAYDSTKEFPLIRSKEQCVVAEIKDYSKSTGNVISLIPMPKALSKIYQIKSDDSTIKFIKLEDIIEMFIDSIFVNKTIQNVGTMRILRESYGGINNDTDIYLKERVRENINSRETSKPILLEVCGLTKKCVKILSKKLDVDKENICFSNVLDYSFIFEIPKLNSHHNLYIRKFDPVENLDLYEYSTMFEVMNSRDVILHHPYESYNPVLRFIEEASIDPDVMSIKQTLYRVSSIESPIINSLCKAAKNGKHVSVLLELKARFDEGQNLALIDKLKKCGCIITFGLEHLKTHCKFLSVTKRTSKGIKIYTHIGTGNYNDKTAELYTDISYFTSSRKIGQSVVAIFNMLSGLSDIGNLPVEGLYYSPNNIRTQIYKLIEKEVKISKITKKPGRIVIKINSLSDKDMIRKLYWASRHNVKVEIICRGVCSMKPINENIRIKSVIGRFLEHSRIYFFEQGGKKEIFISSADLLTRNLDKRVELLCPIRTPDAKRKLLNILSIYNNPSDGEFIMDASGNYHYNNIKDDIHVQDKFINIVKNTD